MHDSHSKAFDVWSTGMQNCNPSRTVLNISLARDADGIVYIETKYQAHRLQVHLRRWDCSVLNLEDCGS